MKGKIKSSVLSKMSLRGLQCIRGKVRHTPDGAALDLRGERVGEGKAVSLKVTGWNVSGESVG